MIYIFLAIYTVSAAYAYMLVYQNRAINMGKTKMVLKLKYDKRLKVGDLEESIFFTILILPAALVAGFRYGISIDYIPIYERGFYRVINNINTDHFELGFHYLIKICGGIIAEPWTMFLTCSFITMILFFKSFKQSKIFLMSVILFFAQGIYFDTFNGIRQYIVAAAFLCCIKYIREGNIKKYMIVMLLCIFIHTSAIITLPLYFLRKIKINYLIYSILLITILLFREQLYQIFIFICSLNSKYYNNFIVKNTINSYISTSTSQFVTSMFALMPMICVHNKMVRDEEGRFFFNMVLFNLALCVCSVFLPLMERVMYYSKVSFLLSIPYACSLIKKGRHQLFFITLEIFVLGSMNVYGMVNREWYAVLPYMSIFSK